MQCFEAARQNRMIVRRGEHLVDQSDREDADGDGGAPGDAGRKHLQWAVDLLNGNQGNGDAAESRRISAIAVQHPGDVDAKSDPDPQHCGQKRAGLGKDAGDGDRCRSRRWRLRAADSLPFPCPAPRVGSARIATVTAADEGD